jgi:hypothetical protein
MRTLLASFLLLAVAPVVALPQAAATPPSAANLVRLHPGPWQLPARSHAALRFEPETGEPAVVAGTPGTSALQTDQARARVLAAQNVSRHADGSLHAELGAAFRSWTVVTIEPDGRLEQDCVSSAAEARARVEASAKPQVHQ